MISNLITDHYMFGERKSSPRDRAITKITIHHMAGTMSAIECAKYHYNSDIDASANYYIGNAGDICAGVTEERRAWTSSNRDNDMAAITIEVSNSEGAPDWKISPEAYKSLIRLVADLCKRYSIKLHYNGTPSGSLTIHSMFAATACPGPYLTNLIKSGRLEADVEATLRQMEGKSEAKSGAKSEDKLYRVQIGAFKNKENAEKLKKELQDKGYQAIIKLS